MVIEVGQHNGWTDTTSLILITYHKKPLKIPLGVALKAEYKGQDIYLYQSVIDSVSNKKYRTISNNIAWRSFTPEKLDEDFILPPYDPINIQIEYNFRNDCIIDVIRGKGYVDQRLISECKCD